MHPKKLLISNFTYQLPQEKIAVYPLAERDAGKLLVYHDKTIEETVYKNISHYFKPGSLLIFNDSKVVEARLIFKKPTGSTIELFCLEPADNYADISTAMQQKNCVTQCLTDH